MNRLQHVSAFLIQFRDAAEDGSKHLPGRIEHVASGRTASFESVEELPQLLLKLLRTVGPLQSESPVCGESNDSMRDFPERRRKINGK
jgi:hypothetical protein